MHPVARLAARRGAAAVRAADRAVRRVGPAGRIADRDASPPLCRGDGAGPARGVWRDDPAIATALDREHLAADELARTLTRVGCAHQVSHLTDLNELAADTRLNLLRLCEQWDATAGAAEGLAGRNRSLLGEAIGELVALDEYLTLLQAVPESNRRIAHAHWPQLKTFLPPTQLRDQLERIVEVDFVPTVLPVGGP